MIKVKDRIKLTQSFEFYGGFRLKGLIGTVEEITIGDKILKFQVVFDGEVEPITVYSDECILIEGEHDDDDNR